MFVIDVGQQKMAQLVGGGAVIMNVGIIAYPSGCSVMMKITQP